LTRVRHACPGAECVLAARRRLPWRKHTYAHARARTHTHTHTLHVDVCMHCRSGGQRQRICVDLQKHSARRLTIPRTCGRERKMARRIARGRNQRRCPHARREKRPLPRPLLRHVLTAPAQPEVPARRSRCWAARIGTGRSGCRDWQPRLPGPLNPMGEDCVWQPRLPGETSGRDRRQRDRQQLHGQRAPQPQARATHPHHHLYALAHFFW